MPNWFVVVIVIGGVLIAGMLRERLRLRSMERFARQRGFVLLAPFLPDEYPPMAELAKRLEGQPATRWGAGLLGVVNGSEFVIAEHEMLARGGDATGSANTIGRWYTMVAWPVCLKSMNTDSGDPWQHEGQLACYGSWAAWRVRGNLTQASVEVLLTHLLEVGYRCGSFESASVP